MRLSRCICIRCVLGSRCVRLLDWPSWGVWIVWWHIRGIVWLNLMRTHVGTLRRDSIDLLILRTLIIHWPWCSNWGMTICSEWRWALTIQVLWLRRLVVHICSIWSWRSVLVWHGSRERSSDGLVGCTVMRRPLPGGVRIRYGNWCCDGWSIQSNFIRMLSIHHAKVGLIKVTRLRHLAACLVQVSTHSPSNSSPFKVFGESLACLLTASAASGGGFASAAPTIVFEVSLSGLEFFFSGM